MLADKLINVGEISGVFGVKGWLKVFSLTSPRENILNYSSWILKKGNTLKNVKLMQGKQQGNVIIARIDDIADREVAASYIGWKILISRKQLPETEADEYYWTDLIGLNVETEQGISLGKVDYLIATGANDVLVVKQDNKEHLIPFLQGSTISKLDLDKKLIVVDWDSDF